MHTIKKVTEELPNCAVCNGKKSRFIKEEEASALSSLGKKTPLSRIPLVAFTYSAFGPFTRNKERIQKFKEAGDSRYIYQNELDKFCFQCDVAYGDFKDLPRRTASDKILRDKAFNIATNLKYDEYH